MVLETFPHVFTIIDKMEQLWFGHLLLSFLHVFQKTHYIVYKTQPKIPNFLSSPFPAYMQNHIQNPAKHLNWNFLKIVNGWKLSPIFSKSSILNVW